MAQTDFLLRSTTAVVDVELPLRQAPTVDVELDLAATPTLGPVPAEPGFRPSLSRAAANPSHARLRWPGDSRSGYHGASGWNWMRDGRAGFGERTIGGA